MSEIDLFIVGAQKAGTTSMKNYLGEHPQIITHLPSEFPFFYSDKEYKMGYENIYNYYFNKSAPGDRKMVCKHAHLYSSEVALQRLSIHNPNCKIIFLLRNPVYRTYSSYLMERLYNRVDFNFDEIVSALDGSGKLKLKDWQRSAIIDFGFYADYLKNIYKYFPKENVSLILFEEFKESPLFFLKDVFRVLNVNPDFQPRVRIIHNESSSPRSTVVGDLIKRTIIQENSFKQFLKKILPNQMSIRLGKGVREINKTGKVKEKMKPETREFLYNFFKLNNEELVSLTGLDISKWSN
ncbi:MAG: sulfotransferase domain-containing protein [Bacteroidota bacterium]